MAAVVADPAKVARSKQILATFRPWIDRYRGGLPAGWVAAIIQHESDGNSNAPGDASLGEIGLMQVAGYVPPLFGWPAAMRATPENNIAVGCLEQQLEAVLFYVRYPDLVQLGSSDSYKLGRLSFSVGRGGAYQLADRAKAAGYARYGDLYGGIVRHVAAAGAPALGSQSGAKVAARVANIGALWEIGQAVDSCCIGPPTLIPDPPAGKYTIPIAARPFFGRGIPLTLLLLGGAAVVLWQIWKRR